MGVRELGPDDWAELWPLVRGFGTEFDEETSRGYFEELVGDPRWVALGYDDGGLIGYAVCRTTARTCGRDGGTTGGCTTCMCCRSGGVPESGGP